MFQMRTIPVNIKTELTSKVIENITTTYASDAHMMEIVNMAGKKLKEIQDASTSREFPELTAELNDADRLRDNAYRSIVQLCEAFVTSGIEGNNHAEEFLKELTADGMQFISGSMHAESDIIRHKLSWLNAPGRDGAVTALNLKPFIKCLEDAQDKFDTVYNSRREKLKSLPDETPWAKTKALDGVMGLAHSWIQQVYGRESAKKVFAPLSEASLRYRAARKPPKDNT